MKVYCGHAIPLEDGSFVVTVICPNRGSYERMKIDLSRIEPSAYGPEIALRETGSATGGGASSRELLNAMAAENQRLGLYDAPPLSPAVEAMIERAEDADQATDDLKAGEAYREHAP